MRSYREKGVPLCTWSSEPTILEDEAQLIAAEYHFVVWLLICVTAWPRGMGNPKGHVSSRVPPLQTVGEVVGLCCS